MEDDLVARIAQAGLTCADRVSWTDRNPGEGMPAITLTRIGRTRFYSHDGTAGAGEVRTQVDIFANSPAEAEELEEAVIALIEPPAIVGSTKFGASFLNDSPDLQPETIAGGIRVFRRAPDIQIFYEPA
jgi:hypothetical protein